MLFKRGILKKHASWIPVAYVILDLSLILIASLIASFVKFDQWWYLPQAYENFLIITIVASVLIFFIAGIYRPLRVIGVRVLMGRLILSWIIIASLLSLIAFFSKTSTIFSRVWMMDWLVLSCLFHLSSRALISVILRWLRRKGFNQRTVLLVGSGSLSEDVLNTISSSPSAGFKIKAHITIDDFIDNNGELRQDYEALLSFNEVDQIWLAIPLIEGSSVQQVMHALRFSTVDISLVPDLFGLDLLNHSLTEVAGMPFLNLRGKPILGLNYYLKRVFDIIFSTMILLIFLPVLLIIALMIIVESGRPVFYKQKRFGWDGKEINVYKFRTMYDHQCDVVTQAVKNDCRVTRLGHFLRKTSLDEFPQFFNVLQGRMSIVGPRPHAVSHNLYYRDKVNSYMQRHMVLPGVTGLAQICGFRGETDALWKMEKRLEKDLEYINSWSLWLDFKIIMITISKVLNDKNAY